MPILIDAYNVLHVTGVLPPHLAGGDLPELAALVAGSRHGTDEVILACDGVRTAAAAKVRESRVRTVFAGPGQTADDLIARLVERSSAPRRLLVVSDDRAVLASARRRRCLTLTAREFLERIALDHARAPARPVASPAPPSLPVREWIAAFGIEPELLRLPASAPKLPSATVPEPPSEATPAKPPAARGASESAPGVDAHLDPDLDLDRLLAGTPPPRDEPRVPRATRASKRRRR